MKTDLDFRTRTAFRVQLKTDSVAAEKKKQIESQSGFKWQLFQSRLVWQ